MINTLIFDMDGVIIDSEPYWQHTQAEELSKRNITLSPAALLSSKGLRLDEALEQWIRDYQLDINKESFLTDTQATMIARIKSEIPSIANVKAVIEFAHASRLKIGLCSSSSYQIINTVLQRLAITNYFDAIHSTTDNLEGKPAPECYLDTANKLNSKPEECIVIEDTVYGATAAHKAGMVTIAMPSADNDDDFSFCNHIVTDMLAVKNILEEKLRAQSRITSV